MKEQITPEQKKAIKEETNRILKSGRYTVEYEQKLFSEGATWAIKKYGLSEGRAVSEQQILTTIEKIIDKNYTDHGYGCSFNKGQALFEIEAALTAHPKHEREKCPDCDGTGMIYNGTPPAKQCMRCLTRGWLDSSKQHTEKSDI